MNQTIILEFEEYTVALACLSAINHMAAVYWTGEGYTVLNGQLIGKNAATGLDDYASERTLTWDTIKESPDGTWYFTSLSGDLRFYAGMEQLYAYDFVEKFLPQEWITDDYED